MLDRSDGSVVGIDFGYSFGIPQMLPIPELIPFRITPQVRCGRSIIGGNNSVTEMMRLLLAPVDDDDFDSNTTKVD